MWRSRSALLAIVVVAVAIAAAWAIRVPLLQEWDESAHLDYAFELYAVGKPFRVVNAHPVQVATSAVNYMQAATQYRAMRYNPVGAIPPGYGSREFFSHVDRAAPPADALAPASGSAMPYAMFAYPAGYYTLIAAVMRLAAAVHPDSIVTTVFWARFANVALLPFTIVFSYGIFVRLHVRRWTAMLATAAIAWLPLTSLVFGYVQPDNLTTLLICASLYSALRWKDEPDRKRWSLALCASLTALAFVKEHYAVATICATFGAGLAVLVRRNRIVRVGATFGIPLVALIAATRCVPVGHTSIPKLPAATAALPESLPARLTDDATYAILALKDMYGGGDVFRDFWLRFGLRNVWAYHGAIRDALSGMIVAATLLCSAACVLSIWAVLKRIARVGRRRSLAVALRLLLADVVLNAYVFVTLILIGVSVSSRGTVWLEGRYWLPVIVPVVALGVTIVPRLFKNRLKHAAALAFASAWALYSILTAPAAFAAMNRAYYDPGAALSFEPYAQIAGVEPDGACASRTVGTLVADSRCRLTVWGYAVDSERGLPAASVFVTIDGKNAAEATTLLPSENVRDIYVDDAFARSGFRATISLDRYGPGRHLVGVRVVETRAPSGMPSLDAFPVNVQPKLGKDPAPK